MITHPINRDHFVLTGFNDTRNVFIQRGFPAIANQRLPEFRRKNEMQVNLRISVSHDIVVCKSVQMKCPVYLQFIPSQKIPNRHTLLPFNLQFLNGQPAISGFEMQVGLAIGAVITRLGVIF